MVGCPRKSLILVVMFGGRNSEDGPTFRVGGMLKLHLTSPHYILPPMRRLESQMARAIYAFTGLERSTSRVTKIPTVRCSTGYVFR